MLKISMLFSTGFLTYLESKILVASLVLAVLASLALGARIICLHRKLTELQTIQSAGSDASDAGRLTKTSGHSFVHWLNFLNIGIVENKLTVVVSTAGKRITIMLITKRLID